MTGQDEETPAGRSAKETARRARQAEALRRNLARRKAQTRGRTADGARERPAGKETRGG